MMTSFHMEGEALVWFQEGEEAGVFGNWEALIQAMLTRFGSTAYDDPMEALTRLRQTSPWLCTKVNLKPWLIGLEAYLLNIS